jgi:predicted acetyltransferase
MNASRENILTTRLATQDDCALMAKFDQIINPTQNFEFLKVRNRGFIRDGYQAVFFLFQDTEIVFALWNEHPKRESLPPNTPQNSFLLGSFAVLEEYRKRGFGRQACEILRKKYWPNNVYVLLSVIGNYDTLEFWKKMSVLDPYLCVHFKPPPEAR